jgi:hypothetical protein
MMAPSNETSPIVSVLFMFPYLSPGARGSDRWGKGRRKTARGLHLFDGALAKHVNTSCPVVFVSVFMLDQIHEHR